ncbi:sodium:alanine symporter, partial [Pseudomonas aeruginosa]|nr:sodium:alanine symporter [Pseudomonas aeruginosa]
FKVGLRVMRDYDVQRRAGIKQPVFDSAQFADLDLDREAWPAGQRAEPPAQADAEPLPSGNR